jgi:DNA invertase Pin-like site-specific DNA recombinase
MCSSSPLSSNSHRAVIRLSEKKYKGRAPTTRRNVDDIVRLEDAGATATEVATRLGIGRASVYRVLADHAGGEWVAA